MFSSLAPNQEIQIVLDVDETLMSRFFANNYMQMSTWHAISDKPIYQTFSYDGYLIYCAYYPGLLEFLQFLACIPNLRFTIFSLGLESLNLPTVKQLLIDAFGVDHQKKVSMFSRHHSRYNAKDLTVTLNQGETIDHTLLIDDSYLNIHPAQRKNNFTCKSIFLSDLLCNDGASLLKANQIFFIVGLLKTALDMGVNQFLDNLQKISKEADTSKQYYPYFYIGLMELKKFNSKLDFYRNHREKSFFPNDIWEQFSANNLANTIFPQFSGIALSSSSSAPAENTKFSDYRYGLFKNSVLPVAAREDICDASEFYVAEASNRSHRIPI
jgi:hypothetical protein